MDRQTKIILIVGGSVLALGALGVGIYFLLNKNAKKDQTDVDTNPLLPPVNSPQANQTGTSPQPLIAPVFNTENELSNALVQLKGKLLYPKEKAAGGSDYTNVRSSAEVNTDQGWWDVGNKITTIYKGSGIGHVLSDTTSVLNGYAYRWFKVNLLTAVGGQTQGYVRADTVTFKPLY